MIFTTAKLCDSYAQQEHFQIAEPIFNCFGGKNNFCGQITTLKVFEDHQLIEQVLQEQVNHRVLVIDAGGSHRCALIGATYSQIAYENGWQGIVIYGCIRNSEVLTEIPIGIRALHAHPLKSQKRGTGEQGNVLTFAGVNFKTDHFLYADNDGIIVSDVMLG
jgi:regulator of ribonuclease activity A